MRTGSSTLMRSLARTEAIESSRCISSVSSSSSLTCAQVGERSVHRTPVDPFAAPEPRPGGLKTTPQIPFPKAQRRDLDRLTRLDLVSELRRRCAKCRYDGGQVSR